MNFKYKTSLAGIFALLLISSSTSVSAATSGSFTSVPDQPLFISLSSDNEPYTWGVQLTNFDSTHEYVARIELSTGNPGSDTYEFISTDLPMVLDDTGSGYFDFDGDDYELPVYEENLKTTFISGIEIQYHYTYNLSFRDVTSNSIVNFNSIADFRAASGYIFVEASVDPEELYDELKSQIKLTQMKNRGVKVSLLANLEISLDAFLDGEYDDAVDKLDHINKKLDKYVDTKKLSQVDADLIFEISNQLISILNDF